MSIVAIWVIELDMGYLCSGRICNKSYYSGVGSSRKD